MSETQPFPDAVVCPVRFHGHITTRRFESGYYAVAELPDERMLVVVQNGGNPIRQDQVIYGGMVEMIVVCPAARRLMEHYDALCYGGRMRLNISAVEACVLAALDRFDIELALMVRLDLTDAVFANLI